MIRLIMKRKIIAVLAVLVALGAAATDRFYIEDFTIAPGETQTVSIMLDNEASYTAFQFNIYMPEGLTVEQEDGDYIFDLTDRKARDHNIASQLQEDGSIRVMSYSLHINAYNGNSGALVTFNVTARDNFEGPATIWLSHILFTTTAGVEMAFNDESCTVTVPSTSLNGDVNDSGTVTISDVTALIDYLLGGDVNPFNSGNADVNGDQTITIRDVTALIDLLLSGSV